MRSLQHWRKQRPVLRQDRLQESEVDAMLGGRPVAAAGPIIFSKPFPQDSRAMMYSSLEELGKARAEGTLNTKRPIHH